MEKSLAIIGGGKTGINLFKWLKTHGISCRLYCFKGEYANRFGYAELIDQNISLDSDVIITSEKAFSALRNMSLDSFKPHYFLRDKKNLESIAKQLNVEAIRSINISKDDFLFPIIVKPLESGLTSVPFKFKVVNNMTELKGIDVFLDKCVVQDYLGDEEYKQVSIAGYFDGTANSLIAVSQDSQYPRGISAAVYNETEKYESIIVRICDVLQSLDFKGFVECEFKKHRGSDTFYIMDINPRPWGWISFYLDGFKNPSGVLLENDHVRLEMSKCWVNTPRLLLSVIKGYSNINQLLTALSCRKKVYEKIF